MEKIDELIDIFFEKARPVGTQSGPIDKNKYIQKKVPVQRDGKTVMVTKYFDPSKGEASANKSNVSKNKDSDNSSQKKDGQQGQNSVDFKPQYKQGDFVKIISDSIGAIVQGSKKDNKNNEFVLSVITEKGSDLEVYEKDVERISSNEEMEKITKDSIVAKLCESASEINKDTPFSNRTKILKDCLKASKNGIVNTLVFGDSIGKNKLIEKILYESGAKKNTKNQKIDKTLAISEINLANYNDEESIEGFLESNSKSLIIVKDFDGRLNQYKKIFKSAIDNTIINLNFDGIFVFNTEEPAEAIPEELKSSCVCVDLTMSKEIKKGMVIIHFYELDGNINEKNEIIKSLFLDEQEDAEKILEKSENQLPLDCILIDADEFENLSGREITKNDFEIINFNDKKIYKIKT